jgi:hypothetical protein
MVRMLGVGQGVEHVVEARYAAAVFGRVQVKGRAIRRSGDPAILPREGKPAPPRAARVASITAAATKGRNRAENAGIYSPPPRLPASVDDDTARPRACCLGEGQRQNSILKFGGNMLSVYRVGQHEGPCVMPHVVFGIDRL